MPRVGSRGSAASSVEEDEATYHRRKFDSLGVRFSAGVLRRSSGVALRQRSAARQAAQTRSQAALPEQGASGRGPSSKAALKVERL
jgi:hypothetical protein